MVEQYHGILGLYFCTMVIAVKPTMVFWGGTFYHGKTFYWYHGT